MAIASLGDLERRVAGVEARTPADAGDIDLWDLARRATLQLYRGLDCDNPSPQEVAHAKAILALLNPGPRDAG